MLSDSPELSAFPVRPLWTFRLSSISDFSSSELFEPQPRNTSGLGQSRNNFLSRVHPSHSVTLIFLNCTKNTELTTRHFARTFCFALNTKINLNSARDPKWLSRNQMRRQQPSLLTIDNSKS
jgi:hypothetical protein